MSHENHFSWQAQYYLVKLECHFSWQVQHFLKFWEIIAGAPNVVFFHTKCLRVGTGPETPTCLI